MARHVIQVPVTKSSCSPATYYYGDRIRPTDSFTPNPIGNTLYMQRIRYVDSNYYYQYYDRKMAFGWKLPADIKIKAIVNIKLYIYAKYSYPRAIGYRCVQFNEGSSLPEVAGSNDGVFGGGFSSGWNSVILEGADLENVVIGQLDYDINGQGLDYAEVYSHRNSTNKPYVEVTYDDIPPTKPSSLYPSGITLSTRNIIRFSWLHNSSEGLQQKAFELQYSLNGGSTWTSVVQTTPNQYYDMPANTLPTSGTVTWRVRTTDNNDEISPYETNSFTLGIVAQKAPVPISPISQYMDQTKPIRFEWAFVGGSDGENQSKFDLQYSTNGGASWTTVSQSKEDTFHELAANTFSGGNITWRVRTYNNWNEVSPYSENRTFTVIGSPSIPLISNITNSARPTISWQTSGQHIYELQILLEDVVIFDSGSIPSTSDRSIKVNDYLIDGNYKARLRIFNEYNLSSPWAEKSFTISTVKPQKPLIEVFNGEYSITIKTSSISSRTLVYRDNILIGEVIDNNFEDFTGENRKEHKYFVRTIDSNDNFADSDMKLARCKFFGSTIALASNPKDFVKLQVGLNNNPKKSNQFGVAGSIQNYDGRKHPIVEFGEFNNLSKTLSFYLQTLEEVNALINMIDKREVFIFRNRDGSNIYGTILGIDYDEEETFFGYEIGFSITKIDYKGVAYD